MSRTRAALLVPILVLFPVLFVACGPGTEEPPESVQETPAEAAVMPEAVVGRYRLMAIDGAALPGAVGDVDGCEVQLSEGSIELQAEAHYVLDVLARAVCDEEEDAEAQMMDRATSDGPVTVEGFEVRFGKDVTRVNEEAWDDRASEEFAENEIEEATAGEDDEAETPDLYDAGAFAGVGTLVDDTTLTVRLDDDLTTMTFVRE